MRPVVRALTAWVIATAVVAGCSAAAPSQVPSASARPSPSPVATTDTAPTPSPAVSPSPAATPAPSTDTAGMVVVASALGRQVRCTTDETRCVLEPSDPAAEPWSVPLDGPCWDVVNPEGTAMVACNPAGGAVVHAVDQDGVPVDGWPVELGVPLTRLRWHDGLGLGCGDVAPSLASLPEGGVAVATSSATQAQILVLEPDGTARPGWPQPLPGDAPAPDGFGGDGCAGFAVNEATGTIVGWGYEGLEVSLDLDAARTVFTVYGPDGSLRQGWPRGSTGPATGPVLRADGGLAYTSGSGKVWTHDAAGEVPAGWPYEISGLRDDDVVAAPVGAPDGQLAVIQQRFTDDGWAHRLHILHPDGRLATDPIDLPGPPETTCLFGDTPCAGSVRPVFHPRNDDLFVAIQAPGGDDADEDAGGSILAFDADGRVRDGWPVALGERVHATRLVMSLDGPLIVEGVTCPVDGCAGGGSSEPVSIVIDRDGRILATIPPD